MNNRIKTGLFIFIVLGSVMASGQETIKTTILDTTRIPQGIKFEGKVKNAIQWIDLAGDNILITTEADPAIGKTVDDENYWNASLYAYHYISKGGTIKQTWRVYDFIKECPLDIEAQFIDKTLQITDLNNDGTAEVWLMYKTVCHGDVSPCDMKVIMYQGQQKFAMRGQNKVQLSENEFYGGDYKFDAAFSAGPAAFREFAKKLWAANIMQTWE